MWVKLAKLTAQLGMGIYLCFPAHAATVQSIWSGTVSGQNDRFNQGAELEELPFELIYGWDTLNTSITSSGFNEIPDRGFQRYVFIGVLPETITMKIGTDIISATPIPTTEPQLDMFEMREDVFVDGRWKQDYRVFMMGQFADGTTFPSSGTAYFGYSDTGFLFEDLARQLEPGVFDPERLTFDVAFAGSVGFLGLDFRVNRIRRLVEGGDDDPTEIPLPAALPLFASALLIFQADKKLSAKRKRRRQSAP
jgi:hypothetical protein